MEKNLNDRQPFPHEDDATFDRTLQQIASQDLMPRPTWAGYESFGRTNYDDFFGDTWHWEHLSIRGVLSVATKLAFAAGYATLGGAAFIWLAQPIAKPLVVLWRNVRGIVRYTLFVGGPVPDRYERVILASGHKWRMGPLFEMSFKECLHLWYGAFTKRVPAMVIGTWLGSKVVWAIEDWKGENAMVTQKKPAILLCGFAAVLLSMSRSNLINFVRAPVYAFATAFGAIWVVDSVILGKNGFDALFNPLRLHLPAPALSVLAGDPFNGELIVGPLKYATINALNAATSALFDISRASQDLASSLAEIAQRPAEPTQSHLDKYVTSIDRRINTLEQEALLKEGFYSEATPSDRLRAMEAQKEHIKRQDEYEKSWINPLPYFTPKGQTRLSTNTLETVSTLFGQDRLSSVVSPLHVPHNTNEIIFGNLNDGILLSTDPAYVENIKSQLDANAASPNPQVIGQTTRDKRFFVKAHQRAKSVAEAATIDPIGFLLTPLVSFVEMLPGLHLFRGDYAFDDYSGKVSHSHLWKRSEENPSQNFESSSADSASPSSSNSNSWQLSEDDMPVQYDIAPLIPPEAAERQKARILIANQTRTFSIDDTADSVQKLVKEDLPVAFGKAGDALARGVEDASEIVLEAGNALSSTLFDHASIDEKSSSESVEQQLQKRVPRAHTTKDYLYAASRADLVETLTRKYVPEDEYFRMIKASVDHGAKAQLPAGITAEERLMNFLENVGGQDFQEPTERVLRHKMPRHRQRDRNWTEMPIMGEERKNSFKQLAFDMKHAIQIRVDYVSKVIDRSTTYRIPASSGPLNGDASSSASQASSSSSSYSSDNSRSAKFEAAKDRAYERLERVFGSSARDWFAEMKSRFTSER